MTGSLYLLHIEIDGHFHGSSEVPKPWVARIGGPCERYGLQREFVQPMNDWRHARRAWSGNTYGVRSTFALRDGNLYEVSRLRGRTSKRYVAREFVAISGGKRQPLDPDEALARAEGDDAPAAILRVREDEETPPYVAEIRGLCDQPRLGFVLVAGWRRYRLREGRSYHIHGQTDQRVGALACVRDGTIEPLSEADALANLASKLR